MLYDVKLSRLVIEECIVTVEADDAAAARRRACAIERGVTRPRGSECEGEWDSRSVTKNHVMSVQLAEIGLQPIGPPELTPIPETMTIMTKKFHHAQTAPLSTKGRASILKAFKDEIRSALDTKDFGVKELYKIATLAEQAHSIIGDPLTKTNNLVDPIEYMSGGVGNSAFLPSSSDENFGAKAIQELISGMNNKKERISDLLDAAQVAKTMGETELYNKILQDVHTRMGSSKDTAASSGKKKAVKKAVKPA